MTTAFDFSFVDLDGQQQTLASTVARRCCW